MTLCTIYMMRRNRRQCKEGNIKVGYMLPFTLFVSQGFQTCGKQRPSQVMTGFTMPPPTPLCCLNLNVFIPIPLMLNIYYAEDALLNFGHPTPPLAISKRLPQGGASPRLGNTVVV